MRGMPSGMSFKTIFMLCPWMLSLAGPVLPHEFSADPTRESRQTQLEHALSGIFAALPKTAEGTVRSTTAQYALHRLFAQLYGWQLYGHSLSGSIPVNTADSAMLLTFGAKMSSNVTQWLHARLSDGGLSITDLATLAAIIEEMVHEEADMRLAAAFRALQMSKQTPLTRNESTSVLEAYMASFVMGVEMGDLGSESMLELVQEVPEQYPTWPATQEFLQGIQAEMFQNSSSLSFRDLSQVIAAVDEKYGRWQSHECGALKAELLQNEEHPGTGRVRLSDFYSMALKGGQWQFSESSSYLRQIGALDETDPQILRVVVPNYILGLSNCIAASSYYMVCCINECDAHLTRLEEALQSHQATVEAILLALNHTVAPSLQRRLSDIAAHHSGLVPLHGRLFAQWLHHLYPHECPYPHMSGTTSPIRPEVFEEESGQAAEASEEEMIQHVEGAPWRAAPTHEEGMCSHMWSMEEELIDPAAQGLTRLLKEPQSQAVGAKRLAAVLAAFCIFSAFGSTFAAKEGSGRRWYESSNSEQPERSAVYSV